MPALARGQENTPSIINWFTTVNGVLTDMHEVGFQIFDIAAGLPGTQIFPTTPGDWETITGTPGHYSVGHYYAYDVGNAQGWTPELTATVGTHRIYWRWKSTISAPYQSDAEDFEVLVQSAGSSADTYISVDDVRAEGVPETDHSDEKVLAYIETWQQFMDRACRQWFNARSMILSVNGNESSTLFFGVPIISVDYVKINNMDQELDPELYRVFSGIDAEQDHRRNPKIQLIGPDFWPNIYTQPVTWGRYRFRKGVQNQEIKGIFGFVEPNGSTPEMIQRALLKLVIEKLYSPVYSPTGASISVPSVLGALLKEKTDGHSIEYGYPGGEISKRRPGLSGITNDPEILDIIKLYRAPIGAATPAHWSLYF